MSVPWKPRLFVCLILMFLSISGAAWFLVRRPSVEILIQQAKQARIAKDLVLARRNALAAVAQDQNSAAAQRILGQIAWDSGDLDEAIEAFEAAARQDGVDAAAAALHGGRLSLQTDQALRAERLWRRALELNPNQVEAASELAYLLGVEGRGWEMQRPLLGVIRGGAPAIHHLVLMAASEPVVKDADLVRRCLARVPDDLIVRTGEARTDLFEGRSEQALLLLREICRSTTATVEAQARLGWALLELHPDQFPGWQTRLKPSDRDHPEIWAVEGAGALRNRDLPQAARCFAQAVRLDPDHRMANYQLGTALSQLGRSQEGQPFLDRASKLQQLALLADRIYAHPREVFQLRQATELTAALGRPYEAWGWCWVALQVDPRLEWASKNVEKLQPWLTSTAPRAIPEALPAIPHDLLEPTGRHPLAPSVEPSQQVAQQSAFSAPRFENVASALGLDFVYEAGSRNRADGVDLIEFTGGGVAAFDYDRDDRCDLYFPQGRAIPLSKVTSAPPDRLFRQSVEGQAVDVTLPAGLGDLDYSQGCTVGDFNQDGFPDLYVCNVGLNRLYRNNGDGTFDDVTQEAGINATDWTVSALFADLNGDGLPELFDVNYLDIDLQSIPFCPRGSEDTHCAPTARSPAPDRLWLNQGDGRFNDVSSQSGLTGERDTGRGLGIVAVDLNGDGQLDIFIANDAEPNFLYFNRLPRQPVEQSGATDPTFLLPRLEESGVVAGVAYDRDGLAQACMGVAIGDADQNGLLDLFVTNYADQSNTLYLQIEPGIFQDATREAGLREPSFPLLGFGTQFLDADLDGRLDLVLANGHVYDMTYAGKLYAMRPQFFRNAGRGRFVESFRETVGDFFGGSYVGRGLARLDWNRDGQSDIAISHIGTPAALLLNRTERPGHHLSLTFSGTISERDAIGTKVRVFMADGLHSTHHLIAGDGYESHNESCLIIGLGSATEGVRLEVQWPSGQRQTFENVVADHGYHLIEGREEMVLKR